MIRGVWTASNKRDIKVRAILRPKKEAMGEEESGGKRRGEGHGG